MYIELIGFDDVTAANIEAEIGRLVDISSDSALKRGLIFAPNIVQSPVNIFKIPRQLIRFSSHDDDAILRMRSLLHSVPEIYRKNPRVFLHGFHLEVDEVI